MQDGQRYPFHKIFQMDKHLGFPKVQPRHCFARANVYSAQDSSVETGIYHQGLCFLRKVLRLDTNSVVGPLPIKGRIRLPNDVQGEKAGDRQGHHYSVDRDSTHSL